MQSDDCVFRTRSAKAFLARRWVPAAGVRHARSHTFAQTKKSFFARNWLRVSSRRRRDLGHQRSNTRRNGKDQRIASLCPFRRRHLRRRRRHHSTSGNNASPEIEPSAQRHPYIARNFRKNRIRIERCFVPLAGANGCFCLSTRQLKKGPSLIQGPRSITLQLCLNSR